MEEINCNLCGANDAELLYLERDRYMHLPGSFRLVRCRQCGLIYLNPRPTSEEIKAYYPEDYAPYTYVAPEDERSRIDSLDRAFGYWKRARVTAKAHPQPGRLLDVGGATGNFLHAMQQRGPWDVHGLDISPEATRYARERYGLDMFTGELAQAAYPDSYFDVVTVWDVLEHVHDPAEVLREMHRILKPGGLLLVRVPNADTWDARLFGEYWVGLDAPRHLYVFSPPTLRGLLEKASFQVMQMRSLLLSYHPVALSVQFWLDERMADGVVKRALLAVNRSRLPRLLTIPLFTLLSYGNHTFATTVFATKADEAQAQ